MRVISLANVSPPPPTGSFPPSLSVKGSLSYAVALLSRVQGTAIASGFRAVVERALSPSDE